MVRWIKITLGMQVVLGPGHTVFDGDTAPHPKRAQLPRTICSAHICCGQMAGWIKMPLGRKVGLDPGDIVLHGDPALLPKRGKAPIFGPCLLWPNGWMDEDATWYGDRPRPRQNCARWGPSSAPAPKKGHSPNFWPMSVVAQRLDGSRCRLVQR